MAMRPARALIAALSLGLAGVALAQDGATPEAGRIDLPAVMAPLLTLDDEVLFSGSDFGKALIARHEADSQTLIAENRRIEAGLEQEEKDLTARRAVLPREEFTPLAEAFNTKVEGIRAAQEAKSRELLRAYDAERQRFLDAVRPVLAEIMSERGAVLIIDKRAVFVGFENVDITDEAIARLNAAYADGRLQPTP